METSPELEGTWWKQVSCEQLIQVCPGGGGWPGVNWGAGWAHVSAGLVQVPTVPTVCVFLVAVRIQVVTISQGGLVLWGLAPGAWNPMVPWTVWQVSGVWLRVDKLTHLKVPMWVGLAWEWMLAAEGTTGLGGHNP